MFRQQHIRRSIRNYNEYMLHIELAGQKVEQINRRDIRPVQIIEEKHQRLLWRNGLQEAGKFALHTLL